MIHRRREDHEISFGQILCEQIRQYILGILSMDPRYVTPNEVMPSGLFMCLPFIFPALVPSLLLFHGHSVSLPRTISLSTLPTVQVSAILLKCFHVCIMLLPVRKKKLQILPLYALKMHPHLQTFSSTFSPALQLHLARWLAAIKSSEDSIPKQCRNRVSNLICVNVYRKLFFNAGHSRCCSWNRKPFSCSITGHCREEAIIKREWSHVKSKLK
jgi:hypothetical protein